MIQMFVITILKAKEELTNFMYLYKAGIRALIKGLFSTSYYGSYGPFSTLKNGFCSIPFEKISVLNLYFKHRYIIIKYRSRSIKGKIHQLLLPFST